MYIDNAQMERAVIERLTQLHYVPLLQTDTEFFRRLFTFDMHPKWGMPNVQMFIKPYTTHTTCIMLMGGGDWVDFGENEDELLAFQNVVKEELGTMYDNLKLLTVVITEHPFKHLAENDNTIAVKNGKICRKLICDKELKKDLKAFTSCYNYAKARQLRFEFLDNFYGAYQVRATYLLIAFLIYSYYNMSRWTFLQPLSVHNLFYEKNILCLVTYMMMHGGLIHLGGNLITTLIVGRGLEAKIGAKKFLLVFILGGMLGGLMSTAFRYDTLDNLATIGCSGAVFALIGAWIVESSYDFNERSFNVINFIVGSFVGIGYIYLCSQNEGIDNACHIAGFASGMAIIILIESFEKIAQDEIYTASDLYIREKEEDYKFFNKHSFDKARTIANMQEDERESNDIRRNVESQWVRF